MASDADGVVARRCRALHRCFDDAAVTARVHHARIASIGPLLAFAALGTITVDAVARGDRRVGADRAALKSPKPRKHRGPDFSMWKHGSYECSPTRRVLEPKGIPGLALSRFVKTTPVGRPTIQGPNSDRRWWENLVAPYLSRHTSWIFARRPRACGEHVLVVHMPSSYKHR